MMTFPLIDTDAKYYALSAHQRARILLVHRSCTATANAILYNTPKTKEVLEGIEQLRKLMDTAIKTIEAEHLIPVEAVELEDEILI